MAGVKPGHDDSVKTERVLGAPDSVQPSFAALGAEAAPSQSSTDSAAGATWISGTLMLVTIASKPKRMRQSTPTLIPNEGSGFSCPAERRCSDMAGLLVIEILR
jgi:hypothetical protein